MEMKIGTGSSLLIYLIFMESEKVHKARFGQRPALF